MNNYEIKMKSLKKLVDIEEKRKSPQSSIPKKDKLGRDTFFLGNIEVG
jgi:hypothetical protein